MTKHIKNSTSKVFLSVFFLTIAILCKAQPVTHESARKKAQMFMEQMGMPYAKNMHRVSAPKSPSGITPYYVFNASDNAGFVIISGDERAETVMGYCLTGYFDETTIPEPMNDWLANCSDQLEALSAGTLKTAPLKITKHKAIDKLITSVWDQGEASSTGDAFNQQCPTISGTHCYTGCVATAMAQVMRYTRWPNTFCSEIPAYIPNDIIGQLQKLPKLKFDWNNMLDKYDEGQSATSRNAVAQLMRYCGQSLEMDYGIESSGAQTNTVAMALRTYFGYDINTRYAHRSDYTIESWDELIYNELSEGRPVIYKGANMGGGHCFVCDGYDGNGFYHINWGWGGNYNGFYKLDILNPQGGGTGSSSSNCGYSLTQGAIVGIQRPSGFDDDMRILSLEDFYRDAHTIYAQFANRTGMSGTFEYGFAYHNINTETNDYHVANQTNLFEPLDMRTVSANLDNWTLSNGTYRMYPYTILEGSGWYRVPGDFKKYYEVVVSGGKITKMTYHPYSTMQINQFTCKGNLIVGMPQEIAISVSNTNDEYNGEFYLFASQTNTKGEPVDKVGLPIEANGESETSLYFTPDATGKWKVWIDIDEEGSNDLTPLELTINKAPTSKSNLSLVSCDIDSKADIIFNVKVKNLGNEGYYRPILCFIFENGKEYNVAYAKVSNTNIAAGKVAEMQFRIEGLEMNKTYYMRLQNYTYHDSQERAWLGNRHTFTVGSDLNPNAIEEIVVKNELSEPSDIYTITGSLVRKGATSLEGLNKGIYLVNGKKYVVR